MSKFSGCIKLLVIAALTVMVLFWMTGAWLDSNVEKVTDAAVSASGIKDAVAQERAARCERAKLEAQQLWDRSLESGSSERYAERIEALDAKVKELCAK